MMTHDHRIVKRLAAPAMMLIFAMTVTAEDAAEDKKQTLLDPTSEQNTRQAPDRYRAKFDTSVGRFIIEVHRDWAPLGADRFYNLVDNRFYDGCRFFRVVPGFVVQCGIHGDPEVSAAWREAPIKDDPVRQSNTAGRVTFATAGPDTRTTQLFISFGDNSFLDDPNKVGGSKFAPIGEVIEGIGAVAAIYPDYGERPAQGRIHAKGNTYLEEQFPKLDYIVEAVIVEDEDDDAETTE